MRVRPLDPARPAEVALVARRMRATLQEVLGAERGEGMATLDWLEDRVRFHLDPARSTGAVLLGEDAAGAIQGHCIVRVERDAAGGPVGWFSTTWVQPEARRRGLARALLQAGEAWFRARGLPAAQTWTDRDNRRLVALYEAHGYAIVERAPERRMVRLWRALAP